jgi:cytochrome oxidase Cu insertion factor (SCO1/SenC/PrrC family)
LASLCRRAPESNQTESGAKMKFAVAILFFVGLFGLSGGQENPPTNQAAPPSVGLEIGQLAPAFALSDQFGHEQSNETLKGSKGTVLLFFRSADW